MAPTTRLALVPFAKKVALCQQIDAAARARDPRVAQVSVTLSGSWSVVEIVRADGFVATDIRPLVRLNVSIVAKQGDRRETGSHGLGGRYLYDRLFEPATWNRGDRQGAGAGAGQPGIGRRAGGRNAGGARPRLVRRVAARSGRPWARRRFQPQGHLGLLRAASGARRGAGRHGDRRRRDRGPPRLAVHRRRGHPDAAHRADRGRHPERLSAGPAQRAADGDAADRQRPPRKLRPCADAAHDQHLHARRAGRPGRADHAGQGRDLRQELRRRPGRHHQRQVRLLLHRGLSHRGRQASARRSRARR